MIIAAGIVDTCKAAASASASAAQAIERGRTIERAQINFTTKSLLHGAAAIIIREWRQWMLTTIQDSVALILFYSTLYTSSFQPIYPPPPITTLSRVGRQSIKSEPLGASAPSLLLQLKEKENRGPGPNRAKL